MSFSKTSKIGTSVGIGGNGNSVAKSGTITGSGAENGSNSTIGCGAITGSGAITGLGSVTGSGAIIGSRAITGSGAIAGLGALMRSISFKSMTSKMGSVVISGAAMMVSSGTEAIISISSSKIGTIS